MPSSGYVCDDESLEADSDGADGSVSASGLTGSAFAALKIVLNAD